MPSIYDLASNYDLGEMGGAPGIRLPVAEAPIAAAPVAAPVAAVAPVALPGAEAIGDGRNQQILSLLGRYFPQGDDYGAELKTARETMTRESEAFNRLLQDAIKQPQETGPSKAEMYFRLAAAFGAPTKTGNFMESLGKAGEAAAAMNKEQREAAQAERARRLQLGLEAQKLRMTGAKEDLNTLRQLAAEGMKDKRTMLLEYLKTGRPQSEAGRLAADKGLQPGTPEFNSFVNKYVDDKITSGNLLKEAMVAISAGQLALAQGREARQAEAASKLTAPELKLKTETEDSLSSVKGAMQDLKRAFDLNKNSMGGSLVDKAARVALETAGSKDPTLLNTQELENILKGSMISTAAEKMKGVLSDSDIKLLAEVSGAKAKNQEERRRILINAYGALQRGMAKQQKRLNEINQGLYRETSPAGGLE